MGTFHLPNQMATYTAEQKALEHQLGRPVTREDVVEHERMLVAAYVLALAQRSANRVLRRRDPVVPPW